MQRDFERRIRWNTQAVHRGDCVAASRFAYFGRRVRECVRNGGAEEWLVVVVIPALAMFRARRSTCAAPSRTECPVTSRTACGTRRERRLFYVLRQTLTPFTKSIESNAIALVGHDDQTSSGRCPPCAFCRRSFVGVEEGITLEHFKLYEGSGEGGCVEPNPAIPPTDVESHVNASARYGARRAATATTFVERATTGTRTQNRAALPFVFRDDRRPTKDPELRHILPFGL